MQLLIHTEHTRFLCVCQNNLPISNEQLGISRCRDGDGARGHGLSEPGTELGDDQLLHGVRDGGACKIHEVRRVGRIDDRAPRLDSPESPSDEPRRAAVRPPEAAGHDKVQSPLASFRQC